MQQKIEKRVLEIAKKYEEKISEHTSIESSLDENGMKECLNEVVKKVQEHRLGNGAH